jgi:DNA polymerase III subunit gamma/tau
MSLATKYRPQTFSEVCGQTITTTILKKVLETKTFKNCYLFCGASGTGKTTVARLFAKAINNGVGDPIEIDAASNSGVDNVRAIIEAAKQRALTGEYKIYILDECQAFSSTAWQAFLKGIEETPKYTIFIFCTTDPQKLPITILNRMQRYNFTPISAVEIKNRLEYICEQEHFTNYTQTCDFISKIVCGGMRDAISYLEQVSDYSKDLSLSNTKQVLSSFSHETLFKLTWALEDKKEEDVISIIEDLYTNGQDLKTFISSYLDFTVDLLKYSLFKNIDLTAIPAYLASEGNNAVQYTLDKGGSNDYFRALADAIFDIKAAIKLDTSFKTTIEILLLQFMRGVYKK